MNSLDGLPGLVRDEEEPHFKAPWEAEAFAIVVALEKSGLFTWSEWASTIGDEIAKANAEGDPDDGSTYYSHWMSALERLVREKNIASGRRCCAIRAYGDAPRSGRLTASRSN